MYCHRALGNSVERVRESLKTQHAGFTQPLHRIKGADVIHYRRGRGLEWINGWLFLLLSEIHSSLESRTVSCGFRVKFRLSGTVLANYRVTHEVHYHILLTLSWDFPPHVDC